MKADREKAAACNQYTKINPIGMYFNGNSWSYSKTEEPHRTKQNLPNLFL